MIRQFLCDQNYYIHITYVHMLCTYICRLEKAFQEKDSDLAKTKESYQTAMAQKNEALPRKYVHTYVCTVYDAHVTHHTH